MNARRAARELALLTLFQIDKQGVGTPDPGALNAVLQRESIQELILSSVRALTGEAEFQIQSAADMLAEVSRSLLQYEVEHPSNLATPLDVAAKPVPIPTTREMIEKIEQCLQGAEYLFEALRVPEFVALLKADEVQAYAIKLIRLVADHLPELDEALNRNMEDWRMDRLVKIDAYILRLAAAEMAHMPKVDLSVSINEAVDLAKQFASDESYRFINGVLGALAADYAKETGKALTGVYRT
jgi:transcription antitermination factor NusB